MESTATDSIDPLPPLHTLLLLPRPSPPPQAAVFHSPVPMTVFALVLVTYFLVVSGIVNDVIVEPPGIGSTQDHHTGTVRPVMFMPARVNGQYIIEGLSSGFMFVLGSMGIVMMDLEMDKNRDRSMKVSFASAGIVAVVIGYVMSMLFIRIKIPCLSSVTFLALGLLL